MKEILLYKLKAIRECAKATNMEGKVSISVDGIPVKEFDAVIDSITEFEHYKTVFSIAPKLECYVVLN